MDTSMQICMLAWWESVIIHNNQFNFFCVCSIKQTQVIHHPMAPLNSRETLEEGKLMIKRLKHSPLSEMLLSSHLSGHCIGVWVRDACFTICSNFYKMLHCSYGVLCLEKHLQAFKNLVYTLFSSYCNGIIYFQVK